MLAKVTLVGLPLASRSEVIFVGGHTFLVIDHNNTAGYQADDHVIELSGGLNLGSPSVDDFL